MSSGREQPYIDGNDTGTYEQTTWLDDVPDIQDGTPVDEQNLNNIEGGVNSANLLGEFIAEVVKGQGSDIENVAGEIIEITLTNTDDSYFNDSVETVALDTSRNTLDYIVDVEIQGETVNVGDVIVYDKQVNGFKVKFTGTSESVDLKLYVHGGNA